MSAEFLVIMASFMRRRSMRWRRRRRKVSSFEGTTPSTKMEGVWIKSRESKIWRTLFPVRDILEWFLLRGGLVVGQIRSFILIHTASNTAMTFQNRLFILHREKWLYL